MINKKFKTETHLHTSDVSPCSKLSAKEMIKLYYEAGYKTIFVSDHFKQIYFDGLGNIPWNDKITIFMSGYYRAREAARQYGMNVLPSAEVAFVGSNNHYLLYGITEDFLHSYPDLCKMDASEFYKIAKSNGIFVVQAHPYRDEKCTPTPDCADAFEIYNSNPRHIDFSEKSEACAKENNLYISAGSDAHRIEDVGGSGIFTDTEITNAEDFIRIIKDGDFQIIGE